MHVFQIMVSRSFVITCRVIRVRFVPTFKITDSQSVRLMSADVTFILTLGRVSEQLNDTITHLPTVVDSLKAREIINKAGVL